MLVSNNVEAEQLQRWNDGVEAAAELGCGQRFTELVTVRHTHQCLRVVDPVVVEEEVTA